MSFVQFNLLPDVKLEFNRAQHAKRIVYALSTVVVGASLILFFISFLSVDVLQKKLLSDANNDINNYSQKLKSVKDLDKILTVQNQLNSLPGLHDKKHYVSRLFTYLPQVVPTNAHIGKLSLDTTASTIDINGTADSVELVNKFVDTLKFTNYALPGVNNENACNSNGGKWDGDNQLCTKPAFSDVLLTKVDRNEKVASYTIDAGFDSALFAGSSDIKLVVPQIITTRSVLNTPGATSSSGTNSSTNNPLFNGQTGPKSTQQGNQ